MSRSGLLQHSVFFGLYPDPAAAAAIYALSQQLRRQAGFRAPLIPQERLHLSLVGLRSGAETAGSAWMAAVSAAASRVEMPPFRIQLDTIFSFKRTGQGRWPVVMKGEEGVIGVTMLCDDLCSALATEGLGSWRPATPHLTLVWSETFVPTRRVPPVSWTAREFLLIDSLQGAGRHEILGRWPLRSASPAPL